MAHLSCVGETTEGLAATLDRIAAAGIENVFALRGDPPRGAGGLRPARGRARQRRRAGRLHRRRLGLRDRRRLLPRGPPRGARPRDRPRLPEDQGRLRRRLPDHPALLRQPGLLRLRRARRGRAGIEVPILAGVIPVASFAQTKRICDLCDASIPPPLEAAFEAAGGDPERRVRARRRLRRPAVRGAADRRRARDPLLRAQPGAGDAGGARRAARLAALGAGPRRRGDLGRVAPTKLSAAMANRREERERAAAPGADRSAKRREPAPTATA